MDLVLARYDEERALNRKMNADFYTARIGIMARQGELHAALSLMVQRAESGVAPTEDDFVIARTALVRAAPDQVIWDNAREEVAKLAKLASEVPGMSATLSQVQWELNRAVELLHMLDKPERRHPDVAEFLDTYFGKEVERGE